MATSSAVDSYRVSELLKGSENYRTWKFSMCMTLQAKELWEVVGGDETARPESDPKGWDKRAKKALAIIALGMSAAEQEHIIDCETPKEAWDILTKLYEGQGRNRKFITGVVSFFDGEGYKHGRLSPSDPGKDVRTV